MGGFLPTVSAAMAATNEGGVHAVEGALRRLFRRDDPYENLDLAATLIETAMGLVGPFFKDRRRPQGLDRAIAAVNAGATPGREQNEVGTPGDRCERRRPIPIRCWRGPRAKLPAAVARRA